MNRAVAGAGAETVRAPARIASDVAVPGDKSITHRALLLSALAHGRARITGAGMGEDCAGTLRCLRALGVEVEEVSASELVVHGIGDGALGEPGDILDCGNSGTTMRLMLGALAGRDLFAVLTGDASLRGRPMGRVTQPLRAMGAMVWGRRGGSLPPIAVRGARLAGIGHELGVASAQVKSALLLAGLTADGVTRIRQPARSRDHTEIMLRAQGLELVEQGLEISIRGGQRARAVDVEVPGDFSAAAFWIVAACVHPDAEIAIKNVGVNPTRATALEVLRRMGAEIEVRPRDASAEPSADIVARSSRLRGTTIAGAEVPLVQDEIPVLAVAAALAEGKTEIRDAAELRVKESDRISATCRELTRLGAKLEERPDGMIVHGGVGFKGAEVDSHGDHRLAMSLAVAGLVAKGETRIQGAGAAAVSDPGFWSQLRALAGDGA